MSLTIEQWRHVELSGSILLRLSPRSHYMVAAVPQQDPGKRWAVSPYRGASSYLRDVDSPVTSHVQP